MADGNVVQEWKGLLCQLKEVIAADIVISDEGEPTEIHVLSSSEKPPKSIARDVQSALMSKYGMEIDHHIISIAQIRPGLAERAGFRLMMNGVEIRISSGGLDAMVQLAHDNHLLRGVAQGLNAPFARRRCVAQATLNAIHQCVPCLFEVAGVEATSLFGESIIVSQIYSVTDNKCFVGSAVVETDQDVAVVQSVLAALNRRIAMAKQGH